MLKIIYILFLGIFIFCLTATDNQKPRDHTKRTANCLGTNSDCGSSDSEDETEQQHEQKSAQTGQTSENSNSGKK